MSTPDDPADSLGQVRAAVLAALRHDDGTLSPLARVGRACVQLLPVDGASISVTSGTQQREMLYASDDISTRIEMVQFSLGEGPCFEAFTSGNPVLVPDLAAAAATSWPVFAAEIADLPIGAIFAFPLHSGAARIGAMDLYRRHPGWLTPSEVTTALQVVDIAALALLSLRGEPAHGEWALTLSRDREQVHQATGMLIAEHGIPAEQALARLRAYAYAEDRLVDDVAHDLVTRRLSPADLEI